MFKVKFAHWVSFVIMRANFKLITIKSSGSFFVSMLDSRHFEEMKPVKSALQDREREREKNLMLPI